MILLDVIGDLVGPLLTRLPPPRLDVTRVDLPVPDLPEGLDGFCIAQISDLHVGHGRWGPQRTEEVRRVLDETRPDVVVNTGDYVTSVPPWDRVSSVVGGLLLARPTRTLSILGNHDHYLDEHDVCTLTSRLEDLGIEVLSNEATCVQRHGAGVSFIGLTADAPGIDGAIDELESVGRPRIALVHEPDLVERLPPGSVDLVLAGHTHGGQIAIPSLRGFIVKAFCGSRYVQGLYRVNGNSLYINRGLGCVGFPLRVWARPEVTLIRLTREEVREHPLQLTPLGTGVAHSGTPVCAAQESGAAVGCGEPPPHRGDSA